ncbi:MAG TPA: hypothetical protein VMZ25_09280 [Terriglobales bacterium]|nr:hypothetical protein [Terriglobales bacterium]
MFENELQDLRQHKWRVDTPTRAVFTADDAREFLHNVGFCLEYPLRHPVLAPTFIGAVIGSEQNLPTAKYAFIHPRAKEAGEFKDRLLREKSAFEAGFGEDDNLLISALEFPYFYSLIGDRNPKIPPSAGERGERTLLRRAFELIQEHGPILETDLRERLGETISDVALSRTLSELRQKLRIVRIEEAGGAMVWDLLMRWSPEVVNQGKQISAQEALSALVSKYLETCIAADQKEVEEFFGHLVPRSRVTEVIKALLGAREFGFIQVNGKTLLRNTPRLTAEEKAAQIAAAAAPKPEGRANRSYQPRAEGEEPKRNVWEKYGPRSDKSAKFDRRARTGDRDERPWKKPEGGKRPFAAGGAKREWKKLEGASRSFAGPKREWKKPEGPRNFKNPGPKRPGQKPAEGEVSGGRAPAERGFGGGMRPPKKFGARPEWKKRDDFKPREGRRPDGKKKAEGSRDVARDPKPGSKFGAKRPWQKSGEVAEGVPRKRSFTPWQERPASDRRPRKFGIKRDDAKAGARPEWKRAAGKTDWKKKKPFSAGDRKFAGPKRPWEKSAEGSEGVRPKRSWQKSTSAAGDAREGSGSERPPRPAAGGREGRPFKKTSGPGGFQKPFKKGFKKPFKKSSSGFGAKPRPRRPA